jgi:Arc/MetJ-type ribon-helix-helix transcriptional regulator
METQRMTIRLPKRHINSIDMLIRAGEYATRSEVIRHAINDFIKRKADSIIEEADRIKKVQELNLELESIEPYTKK